MSKLKDIVANNANDIMAAKGWSVSDIVGNGLSQSTAYRILRAGSEPTLKNSMALAEALGVSLNRLIKA